MSEALTASVGDILREAREAQGLSVEDAANRLRLMHRQIMAMETGNVESLGQPVFARGFVRNYARLLGLDPEPLLARMAGAPSDAMPVCREAPAPGGHWLTAPWLILLALAALLLTAVPVGLYWWLNSDGDADAPPRVAPSAPGADAAPAPAAPAPAAPAPAAPDLPPTPAQPEASVLRLDFGVESWVEIKDASGRMLMRQLNLPDTHAEIRGRPPFDIVIGNAAGVRLQYNDRPIDLAPYIDLMVARFTLEE